MTRDPEAVVLSPDDMPTRWYNVQADLPEPVPPPKDPDKPK